MIQSLGIESGLIVDTEPFGLFSHLIPASAYSENGHLFHHRERQGLVPDFLVTSPPDHGQQSSFLCELKLISMGLIYYQSQSGDRSVEIRAKQLPKLYRDKAKNIDKTYCRVQPNQKGPVERRLEQFGDICCFVIGQFSEASPDLHSFISKCASSKSKRMANVLGRPPSAFEESQILQQLRRRLSVCATRAQASCMLARLGHTTLV